MRHEHTAADKGMLPYEAKRENAALRANLQIILLNFQSEELKKGPHISEKP